MHMMQVAPPAAQNRRYPVVPKRAPPGVSRTIMAAPNTNFQVDLPSPKGTLQLTTRVSITEGTDR